MNAKSKNVRSRQQGNGAGDHSTPRKIQTQARYEAILKLRKAAGAPVRKEAPKYIYGMNLFREYKVFLVPAIRLLPLTVCAEAYDAIAAEVMPASKIMFATVNLAGCRLWRCIYCRLW